MSAKVQLWAGASRRLEAHSLSAAGPACLSLHACCRSPPNIYFKKKKTGGVSINSTLMMTKMDDKLIQRILQEYKIHNCEVT
jgi:hypothetical protein